MTRTTGSVCVATMLLACGLAAPAAAQRVAGDDNPIVNSAAPVTDGIVSVLGSGAGFLLKGLSIEGSLQTTYDGNIRRLGEGLGGDDGDQADFRITPSVVVSNLFSVGRQQIFVSGQYGRDFYLRDTSLNRDRYGIAGGINARAGSFCAGTLQGNFRSRQSLNSEASIGISNLTETTTFSASANCQRPAGLGFGINAAHDKQDNKDLARDLFDSRTNSVGANVSYSRPALGTFSLGGTYADTKYPRRTTIVPTATGAMSAGDAVTVYSANLGYRRAFGPRLSVNVGGSYYKAKPKPRDVLLPVLIPVPGLIAQQRDAFSGLGYIFGLAYRSGTRLTADITAARNISQSSNVGALFTVRDSFGFDVGYNLGPSISTGVGATYDIRRYRNAFASIEERDPRVRDDLSRVYGRISYSSRRLFDVDFEVAHQRRESNPSTYDYKSLSAALTLRVKFGRG